MEVNKEPFIRDLFASIAQRYDLLNSILSFGRHKAWRKFAARQCGLSKGDAALDVCAGTLDFAIELSQLVGPSGMIVAVDFCKPMLEVGRRKLQYLGIKNILLVEGNAEHLPVSSNTFHAATIGFALRNVVSIEQTIAEMTRAVELGGKVVCLELTVSRLPVFQRLHGLYLHRAVPLIGRLLYGRNGPYDYLPASIETFCSREELSCVMEKVGLSDIMVSDLTGGVTAVHVGTKK